MPSSYLKSETNQSVSHIESTRHGLTEQRDPKVLKTENHHNVEEETKGAHRSAES
jgi:hypothetical protein